MKFLLQTIKKRLVHDFTFELTRCEEYHKWIEDPITLRYHEGMDFSQIKHPDTYVPVGSVEFVSNYLKTFYPEAVNALKPLNVPEVLFPFAGRTIANVRTPEDMTPFNNTALVFVKSLDIIKDSRNGFIGMPDLIRCEGFQVSKPLDFMSEWRVFVFQDAIQDCRCYQGNNFAYPDPEVIKKMVSTYMFSGTSPKTYTLDVGVTTKGETVVVECHRFFSCGLYGFSQPNIYPAMLSQEWYEMKQIR